MRFFVFTALVLTATAGVATANVTVDGAISRIINDVADRSADYSSVEYVPFRVTGTGAVAIDVLSWEVENWDSASRDGLKSSRPAPVDVNNDGAIAFIDAAIRLFRDDGALDADDFIEASFASDMFADGSISQRDPGFSLNLDAGDYLIAIGAGSFSLEDAISGMNTASGMFGPMTFEDGELMPAEQGAFRVAIDGPVARGGAIVPLPTPAVMTLFGLIALGGARAARRRR